MTTLVAGLPADLPAAVLIAIHITPEARSRLPQILGRAGILPAQHPVDGEPILAGRIYVAPPDHHLSVGPGQIHLSDAVPSIPGIVKYLVEREVPVVAAVPDMESEDPVHRDRMKLPPDEQAGGPSPYTCPECVVDRDPVARECGELAPCPTGDLVRPNRSTTIRVRTCTRVL